MIYPGQQGWRFLYRSSQRCENVGTRKEYDGWYVSARHGTTEGVFAAGTCTQPLSCFLWTDDADEAEGNIEIPLPNVKSQVLQKVIEFCEHHLTDPMSEIEKPLKSQVMADVVQTWYADFVDLEQVLLFELILAANYMDIKPLLDLTCATVASMIKGKS